MKLIKTLLAVIALCCIFTCNSNIVGVPDSPYPISNDSFSLDTIAEGFTIPFGIAIVEENEYFITDRVGRIKQLPSGDVIALIERNDLTLSNGYILRITN